jgi:hypothetical protein
MIVQTTRASRVNKFVSFIDIKYKEETNLFYKYFPDIQNVPVIRLYVQIKNIYFVYFKKTLNNF